MILIRDRITSKFIENQFNPTKDFAHGRRESFLSSGIIGESKTLKIKLKNIKIFFQNHFLIMINA